VPTNRIWVPTELWKDSNLNLRLKAMHILISGHNPKSMTELGALAKMDRRRAAEACQILASAGWIRVVRSPHGKTPVPILAEQAEDVLIRRFIKEKEMAPFEGQFLCLTLLDICIDSDAYYDNARPDFLVSGNDERPLEFDRIYFDLDLAGEFQGDQHYQTTAKYSDSKALFNRQFRDFRKSRLSERKGITLVEFRPEDLSIEGILNKLPSWVPLRTINKDSKYVQTVEKHCQNYIERTFRARSLSR
jgi:DNA-binding MarR family transcriptional regulator